MSKTKALCLIGLTILGGYLILNYNKTDNISVVKDKNEPQIKLLGKEITFSELLKRKGSYECSVDQYFNDVESTGTMYIHNGMIRGEFNTKVPAGMDVDSNLIVRDGYTYGWTATMPGFGFKVKIVENTENQKGTTDIQNPYNFNMGQSVKYDCKLWFYDQSKFNLPSDVIFRDAPIK